ncbi:MAG: hypothetical protein NVS9B10_15110 [Nevskia sp.]
MGCFPELEDEICDFDPVTSTKSPERMDALVWAITELMVNAKKGVWCFGSL